MQGFPPLSRLRIGPLPALVAGILLLGLALRLALALTAARPPEPWAVNDEAVYMRLASNLAEGHGFSASQGPPWHPTAVRTPGWPLLLALGFTLGGPTVGTGLATAAVADALTALVLFFAARRASGSTPAGVLACVCWTLLSPLLPLLEFLYPDPAGALLVGFAAWVSLPRPRDGALLQARVLAGGAAWGAAVLVRPFLLPAALAAGLATGLATTPGRRRRLPLWMAGLVLVLAPWTLRNAVAMGAFLPLSQGGVGMNLWVGTWKTSGPVMVLEPRPGGGTRAVFAGPYAEDPEEARRARRLWNAYMQAFLGEGGPELKRWDGELRTLALERIRRRPWAWLGLRARNALEVWTFPQVPGGRILGVLLVLSALGGLARLVHAGRWSTAATLGLPVLALALSLFPLRTLPRYAANVAPLVFLLATCALGLRPGSGPAPAARRAVDPTGRDPGTRGSTGAPTEGTGTAARSAEAPPRGSPAPGPGRSGPSPRRSPAARAGPPDRPPRAAPGSGFAT